MFMIPMPPTSRLIAATAASSAVSVRVGTGDRVGELLLVHDAEVVIGIAGEVAALAHQAEDVLLRPLARRRRADGELNLLNVLVARESPLQRPQRDDDRVITILAECVLAFGLEQSDDCAGERPQPEPNADGILRAQQLFARGLADDADRCA